MNGRRNPGDRRRTAGRRLTDRQSAILELVAHGLANKDIALELGISEQAVKEHVSALLRRLEVRNRAALGDAAATRRVVGEAAIDAAWLDLVFRRAPLIMALLQGPDHRFLAVNEQYTRAAGGRDVVGLTFREAYPDHDPNGLVRLLDESYAAGEPRSASELSAHWHRHEGQRSRGFLNALVAPMHRDDGSVGGTALFAVDVTEAAEARAAVAVLATDRQAVLELVPSGVVTVDAQGRVTSANALAARTLEVPMHALVGATASQLLQLRDPMSDAPLPADRRPLRRALRGEHVDDEPFVVVLASGRRVRVRVRAVPLVDGEHVRGAVAVFTEADASG